MADGMTGQDAVNSAQRFQERIDFDGVVLTKMDGDARGGAALSIRAVTGKPIQFVSTGEKLRGARTLPSRAHGFAHPGHGRRGVTRRKSPGGRRFRESRKLAEKISKQTFDLEDFLEQLQQVKKMGPMDQLLGMIPGAGAKLSGLKVDESSFSRRRGHHPFHDRRRTQAPERDQRQPEETDRRGERHERSGRQPPAEAVPEHADDDETHGPHESKKLSKMGFGL